MTPPGGGVGRTAHGASAAVGRCTALSHKPKAGAPTRPAPRGRANQSNPGSQTRLRRFVPRRHLAANVLVLASNARPRMALGFDLDLAA